MVVIAKKLVHNG